MKLLHEKLEQAKKAGLENAKTINAIERENFINCFNIPDQMYDAVMAQITGEAPPENLENAQDLLPTHCDPSEYLKCSGKPAEIFTVNKGKERGTMFKIDTGGYVFSCLFDSGAKISCMNMETVATLGLVNKITDSSISVNKASGQNMAVTGDMYVTFKIGKKHSFTHKFVVCECLSRPFILGEDYLWKHKMSLQ